MNIPKIIHQVYEDISGPPEQLKKISFSWKQNNPEWQYIFWGKKEIESLLNDFPELIDDYNQFPYDIQRWDIIRLLILYKYGGLYVDIDYECFRNLDPLFDDGNSCYIGLEPYQHAANNGMKKIVGNAFIASVPGHDFIKHAIDNIFLHDFSPDIQFNKGNYIVNSTGPFFLTKLYDNYEYQETITLINPDLVTPLTIDETRCYNDGVHDPIITDKLKKSYAVHYFAGTWWSEDELRNKILNHLIINSMTIDISLANGLTGIVIFIYELSRTTQNKILENFADELVDRILNEFNKLPYTFSDGVIGMGCGIQYLINNCFLEANEDVLEDLDEGIFKLNRNKYRFTTNFFDYYGPGLYYLSRISKKNQKWDHKALNFIEKDILFSINCNDFNISGKYLLSLAVFVTYAPKLPDSLKQQVDIFISSKLNRFLNSELFVLNFLVNKSNELKITQNRLFIPEKSDFLEIAKTVQVLGIIVDEIRVEFGSQIKTALKQVMLNKSQLGLAGLAGLGLVLAK